MLEPGEIAIVDVAGLAEVGGAQLESAEDLVGHEVMPAAVDGRKDFDRASGAAELEHGDGDLDTGDDIAGETDIEGVTVAVAGVPEPGPGRLECEGAAIICIFLAVNDRLGDGGHHREGHGQPGGTVNMYGFHQSISCDERGFSAPIRHAQRNTRAVSTVAWYGQ